MSHGSHISQGGSVSTYCQRQRSQQYCASQLSQARSHSLHGHFSICFTSIARRCPRIFPPDMPGSVLLFRCCWVQSAAAGGNQNKASRPAPLRRFCRVLLARGGIFRPAVHSARILCSNVRPAPVWLHLTPLALRLLAGPVLALVSCFHQLGFVLYFVVPNN